MPDNQAKPAEMSFSDWKKMKNALNSGMEATTPKTISPRNGSVSKPANNYNRDIRKPQNMQYFEHLKQNNRRIFGGGFFNNLPLPQVPFFNSNPSPNSMMGNYNQHQNTSRSNYLNSRPQQNNFMSVNNFMMPRRGIPQQPFPMNNHANSNRAGIPSRFTNNKQASSNNQRKVADTNSTDSKVTKEIARNPFEPECAPDKVDQDTADPKAKKQKRWTIKPQKPPIIIATTPESKEEKQRMWREYRQKMKPFKNRDFHNAKRVIQRLGKKNIEELDEKEKERLARAKETVAAHKAKLTENASRRWTLAKDLTNSPTTSVYVTTSRGIYAPRPAPVHMGLSNSKPGNDNNSKQTQITTSPCTGANEWNIWNNFVPCGSILSSTTK